MNKIENQDLSATSVDVIVIHPIWISCVGTLQELLYAFLPKV